MTTPQDPDHLSDQRHPPHAIMLCKCLQPPLMYLIEVIHLNKLFHPDVHTLSLCFRYNSSGVCDL